MTDAIFMPDTILGKEAKYVSQMADVREIVLRFAQEKNWSPLRRGRHAHASIYGPLNGLNGVIDIQMKLLDWDIMPSSLAPDFPFDLFCGATLIHGTERLFSDRVLFWQVPFGELEKYVPLFLKSSWQMLEALTTENFLTTWPGPYFSPDMPPNFGPPRIART